MTSCASASTAGSRSRPLTITPERRLSLLSVPIVRGGVGGHGSLPVPRSLEAADLKRKLSIAERRGKLKALGLIAPLFLFIIVSFVVPIALMLSNAVYDPDISDNLPNTVAAARRLERQGTARRNSLCRAGRRPQGGAKRPRPPTSSASASTTKSRACAARSAPTPARSKAIDVTALQGAGAGPRSDVRRPRVLGRDQAGRRADHQLLSAQHARSADQRRRRASSASTRAGRSTSRSSAARCTSACSSRS